MREGGSEASGVLLEPAHEPPAGSLQPGAELDFIAGPRSTRKVVLELAEMKERETATQLLRETAPMLSLKQANPERQGL